MVGAYLVVRIKGQADCPYWATTTMTLLKLDKKYRAVILPAKDNTLGMLNKVKHYVSWTTLDASLAKELVDKKARINDELTAALYYNIGMAYFICEDYLLAYENLLKASEFDKNVTGQHFSLTKDSKTMIDRAANKK